MSLSGARADQQSVEGLIRRLIERVEESERRYSEALEDLHARLDQLTQTTEALPTSGTAEETETLARLRNHLSSLTERLEQPKATGPGFDELAKLDRALAEAREAAAGLEADFGSFPPPPTPASLPFPESVPSFGVGLSAPEPGPAPFFGMPPLAGETADLDKRLIDMANRLERSIAEANAKAPIETLNQRMEELSKRFEAALSQSPGSANLKLLEQQIGDIGRQVGRVEQQLQRFSLVETELNRLIERFEGIPAQITEAASKAANEAARLVAETGGGSLSAVERLDAIHRDLVAMNERSRATDDRVVDTLAAVHESLKGLVNQLERGNRVPPAGENRVMPKAPEMPEGHRRGGFTLPPQLPGLPPFTPERLGARAPAREDREEHRSGEPPSGALRNRLRATLADLENEEPAPVFGRAKRFEERGFDAEEAETRPFTSSFEPDSPRDSIDDLVAAARRASQAAAARAEDRGTPATPLGRTAKEMSSPIGTEVPERRKRSVLILAAAFLLLVSAALLYSRLRSKPEAEAILPTAEQTVPAPSSAPAPAQTEPAQTAPQAQPTPPVATDVVPELPPSPEAAPAPNTTPDGTTPADAPHPTTPSSASGVPELAPPVRVSDAPVVVGAASGPDVAAEASLKPEPVSLRNDVDMPLPPGVVAFRAPSVVAPSHLPLPDEGAGPLPLREAASAGDARAQYVVGIRYAQAQKWSEAARWFALAAASGLVPAQYRLAVLYERGDGVGKDLGLAKSWYARAAEQGNVKAMHNLAVAVSRESASADYALAAKWYAEAASYGLADSQFNLGVLAEHGLGMRKDLTAAYRWFALAAASRDPEAVKRRDSLKAALSIVGLAEADAAVAAWKAKPAKPEANQVPEEDSWRAAEAIPNRELVARAQELLNTLGYQVGTADGEAGSRTREAIKAFELRNGMDQTGEVTHQLVNKLQQLAS
jgi:localization factor PodJL